MSGINTGVPFYLIEKGFCDIIYFNKKAIRAYFLSLK